MNIKIQDLTKVYPDGHKALNGLNLNIEPGMFGLLGPNGAGKTTLMRIMTLLQNPSSGTIFFDDYDILRDRKAIRSVLGYLPQDFRKTKNLGISRLRGRTGGNKRHPEKVGNRR